MKSVCPTKTSVVSMSLRSNYFFVTNKKIAVKISIVQINVLKQKGDFERQVFNTYYKLENVIAS